jgi:hypothetical protein
VADEKVAGRVKDGARHGLAVTLLPFFESQVVDL